ncbi:type IV toxin-antitoxin system AbiEi family antitoxin domain-containing protein [bacterium]|nr:type IV toxin-antitoxin system AbiEi family antitoxin domain-containing protein [bacterium]
MSVMEEIRRRVGQYPLGEPFSVSEMRTLGQRAAVDQALSRLARTGEIHRVARGFYARPKISPVLGPLSVSAPKVALAAARAQGAQLSISGAEAANRLGLSTQVPTQTVFWSDGPRRKIRVGNQTIVFKPRRLLAGTESSAGPVISALKYLGRKGLTEEMVEKLARELPVNVKEELQRQIPHLPAWMEKPLLRICR